MRTDEVLQRVRTKVDEVLQRVRTKVDDVDGGRAARTNVGQRCVRMRFCNAYERSSTMLTVDEQCVRM